MSMMIHATQNGKSVTAGASSANTTLPVEADGLTRLCRVTVSGRCYIKFGVAGVTVSSADGILMVPQQSEVFAVTGVTHIAYIDGPDAGAVVNLVPVGSVR